MKKSLILILTTFFLYGCQTNTIEKKEIVETKKVFPELKKDRYNVAFLIMDGTFNTELTAPFDIFQHTIFRKNIKAMNVFTVANTDQAITTFEGMRIMPDYNYLKDSLPKIDIFVVPSAEHHLNSDLEDIADGGAALTAYGKLQYSEMNNKERLAITDSLLRYCELDTLAMVMIYEHLKELVN